MEHKNQRRLIVRKIGRICGWAGIALLLFTLLTGYGITEFRFISPLTFGLVNKAVAQRLHAYTELPMMVLLLGHIGIAVWFRKHEIEGRSIS